MVRPPLGPPQQAGHSGPDGRVRETVSTSGFWGILGCWPPPAAWSKASQREPGCRLGTGSCAGLWPPHRTTQASRERCRAATPAAEPKGRPAPVPAVCYFPKLRWAPAWAPSWAISDPWDALRPDTALPSGSSQRTQQLHGGQAVREQADQAPRAGGAASDLHLWAGCGWGVRTQQGKRPRERAGPHAACMHVSPKSREGGPEGC